MYSHDQKPPSRCSFGQGKGTWPSKGEDLGMMAILWEGRGVVRRVGGGVSRGGRPAPIHASAPLGWGHPFPGCP